MKSVELIAKPLLRLAADSPRQIRGGRAMPVFTFTLWNMSHFIAEYPFVYLPSGLMEVRAAGTMALREVKSLRALVQISPMTMTRIAPGDWLVVCQGIFAPGNPSGGRFVYLAGAANMPLQKSIAMLEPAVDEAVIAATFR